MEKTKGFEDFLREVSKNTKIRYMGNRYYIVNKNIDKQSSPTEYLDFFLLNTGNGPIIIEKSVAYEIKDRLNELEKLIQKLRRRNLVLELLLSISWLIFLLYIFFSLGSS